MEVKPVEDIIHTDTVLDHNGLLSSSHPHQKPRLKLRHKLALGAITILIMVGCLFIPFKIQETTATHKADIPTLQSSDFYQTLTITDFENDWKAATNVANVKKLVVLGGEKLSLSHDAFPYLRQVVIDNPELTDLEISGDLEVDTLVVNNTKLEKLSVNSTKLRKLVILNNSKMKIFWYSKLPSLSNMTVVNTNFEEWGYGVQLGQLENLIVSDGQYRVFFSPSKLESINNIELVNCDITYIQFAYLINFKVKSARFQNCRGIKQFFVKIKNSNYLEKLVVKNCDFYFLEIENHTGLKSLHISSNSDKQVRYLSVSTLPKLQQATLDIASTILSLALKDCPELNWSEQLKKFKILTQLFISNMKLDEFQQLQLSALEQLDVDFDKMQGHSFNFSNKYLKQLRIQNYKGEQLVVSSFPSLNRLELIKLDVSSIKIRNENLRAFRIIDSSTGEDFLLDLETPKLEYLAFQRCYFTSLSNLLLQNLAEFAIRECPNLQRIQNNVFRNISVLTIDQNSELTSIANNTLTVQQLKIDNSPKLEMQQKYNDTVKLTIGDNKIFDLSRFEEYFPSVQQAFFNSFQVQNLKNLNSSSMTSLYILNYKTKVFSSAFLPSLTYLSASGGFTTFSQNYLPSLQGLSVPTDYNLDEEQFVVELRNLKKQGTDLKLLRIPFTFREQIVSQIKEIFPNAAISN